MAMEETKRTIVWFSNDFRIEDHPALLEASMQGEVILLYIHQDNERNETLKNGKATNWWLHHSIQSLQEQLKHYAAQLIIRKGDPLTEILAVLHETKANAVYWNRRYERPAIASDQKIIQALLEEGIYTKTFRGNLLYEPWTINNKSGRPFKVFTPFWKGCLQYGIPEKPLPTPLKLKGVSCQSLHLNELMLLPQDSSCNMYEKFWVPGTIAAKKKLSQFISNSLSNYAHDRDFPNLDGVSLMSPYLHFGEISPNMIWHTIIQNNTLPSQGAECYLRQLGWREFAYHLLYHFPETSHLPLRKEFLHFPWREDHEGLKAWQEGNTGYPIVDAGMRQLKQTGWMHNRVRMVVGSFLVKDLLIHWHEGANWFWDKLVDADLPNNTLGWQWIGGCGADAAPYFRVFNPVLQGEKFDPNGEYVKKWVPELRRVPERWIHRPWEAPEEELLKAKIQLGKQYPLPIVDHPKAKERALMAFQSIKSEV